MLAYSNKRIRFAPLSGFIGGTGGGGISTSCGSIGGIGGGGGGGGIALFAADSAVAAAAAAAADEIPVPHPCRSKVRTKVTRCEHGRSVGGMTK